MFFLFSLKLSFCCIPLESFQAYCVGSDELIRLPSHRHPCSILGSSRECPSTRFRKLQRARGPGEAHLQLLPGCFHVAFRWPQPLNNPVLVSSGILPSQGPVLPSPRVGTWPRPSRSVSRRNMNLCQAGGWEGAEADSFQ